MAKSSSKSAAEMQAKGLAKENEHLKIENVQKEDDIKRMASKLQKIEADIAMYMRKDRARGVDTRKQDHDKSSARLELAVAEKTKEIENISRQILLLKYAPETFKAQPKKKPVVTLKRQTNPTKQVKETRIPVPASQSDQTDWIGKMSKSEQLKMIETLKIELQRATERLNIIQETQRKNQDGDSLRSITSRKGFQLEDFKKEIQNFVSNQALLDAEEETLILSIQSEKKSKDQLEVEVDRLKTELAKIKSRGVDLVHQQQILELRKDEHEKLNQHVQDLRDEIESLEAQNSALRQNAFSAGHVKVHARVLGGKVQELNEELVDIRKRAQDLQSINDATEKEKNLIEVDGEESIARLKARSAEVTAKIKLLDRQIETMQERKEILLGSSNANSQPKMNDKSALEAKRLAQRSGTPLYLRKQGSSESDESTALSQEVRRLTLENNWQRRETNKLKEMLRLQEPLELHRSRLSNRESKEEEKLRQVHMKKVTYLQRKILQVQDRIDQMKEVVTHSRSDSTKQKGLKPADLSMLTGRAIFAIDLQGLEIDRSNEMFRSIEPTTMLAIDFYLHDTQFGDPVNGCNPQVKMRRDLEVVVDDMLIEFLYSEKLLVHLINVQGTDFEIIASGAVSMNDFVFKVGIAEVSYDKLPLRNVNGTTMATVNLNVSLLGDISRMASQFQASLSSSPTIKQSKRSTIRHLYEDFPRKTNATYMLVVKIKSVVGLESRSVSFDKSKFGAVQRKVSVMFQVLDFPVAETRTVPIIEGSKSSSFDDETKSFPIPTDSSWNQRLVSGHVEFFVLDNSEFVSDDYIGSCRLSLAPLFSKRGLHSDLKIRDSHSQRGVLEVEVSWEEEPLHAGDREMDQEAISCLEALVKWVEHLGLGSVELAAQALFESWESRSIEVLSEGFSKETWISYLSEDKTIFERLKLAELHYIFDYLTKSSSSEQSRRLSKATFLHAICFPTHAVGDKRECPICKQGKREAVAERTSDLSGDALSLHIRQVKCMDALLREDSIKELALRVLCLRGKLDKVDSEPFDNSNVAGGFVAVGKTWGSSEKERLSMKKMLQEERSMEEQLIEVQLIRHSSPMPDSLQPEQLLAFHRFSLADIASHDLGDLTVKFFSSAAIGRWKEGEHLLEAKVDIVGKKFLNYLKS